MLAYDRPSHKFISFLRKHCGLYDYTPQNNNFVVFNDYFESMNEKKEERIKPKPVDTYNGFSQNYFNPYDRADGIAQKQKKGVGVFSALGSQILQRSESVNQPRQSYSAYDKFQGIYLLFLISFLIEKLLTLIIAQNAKRTPGYSQANFNKSPTLFDSQPQAMVRQKTYYQEENKAPVGSRDSRLDQKFNKNKRETYITSSMVGMDMQSAPVPQKSRHMMKF